MAQDSDIILSSGGGTIVFGKVGTAHLARGAVTEVKLANNSVTTPKIPDGAITKLKLHTALQTLLYSLQSKIQQLEATVSAQGDAIHMMGQKDAKVYSNILNEQSVSAVHLMDGAVTGNKIVNGAVSDAKLSVTLQTKNNRLMEAVANLETQVQMLKGQHGMK